MKERVLKHKKAFTILIYAFLAFLGCFAFPIYNITKEYPVTIRYLNIFVACIGYYEIGLLQGALYGKKAVLKTIAVSFGMTLVGFMFRFLLEYGEVSNTYNFTFPNIALHMAAAIILTALSAFFTNRE
ncbi:hypothetical protein IMSAG049_00642 [Clostridiales bacterium]|nr:hypothetical protein IMSAG049_00642 [Clostridiales bacterium]